MSLRLRNLVRQHPGSPEPTLKGMSVDLPKGTLTAVVGRSGAGKSTMLRCVVGLEPFESGCIEVAGAQVRGTRESTPRRRAAGVAATRAKLGLVFQSYELFPHLTVLENCVLAPVKVKGVHRREAEADARALLAELGLERQLDAWPEQLSGGQRQRVAIARAWCMKPEVLLYDEPTAALDPSLRNEVLQTLKRVDSTGVTQVVVTHDLQLARAAEFVCVLDDGLVVEAGPTHEVLARPRHEATKSLLGS